MQQFTDKVRDLEARIKALENFRGIISTNGVLRVSAIGGVIPPDDGGTGIMGSPLGVTVWLNDTGSTVGRGSVVRHAGDDIIELTDVDDDPEVIGVVDGSTQGADDVPDGGYARVRHIGYQPVVLTVGTVAAGDYLAASTSGPGGARSIGPAPLPGAFAIALTADAGSQCSAFLFPVIKAGPRASSVMLAPGAVEKGSLATLDTGQNFNVSTAEADPSLIGVTLSEAAGSGDPIEVLHHGYVAELRVFGTVAVGDHLYNGDSGVTGDAGVAVPTGRNGTATPFKEGTIGYALGANASGAGTIPAFILQMPVRVDPVTIAAQTTDATPLEAHYIEVPATTTLYVEVEVAARRTGGSAGTAEDAGGFKVIATFKNVAGIATLVGTVTTVHAQADQAWTVDLVPTTTDEFIYVELTGATNNDIDWLIHATTLAVS